MDSVVIDLGSSSGGAVFDAVGVSFAITGGDAVGFSGNFSLSGNQLLTLRFSGFGEGETFLFQGDLDDAGGGYTTGSEVTGATLTVTRASGTLGGSFFAHVSNADRAIGEAGNQ